jgi:hypothetical protein
MRGNYRDWAQVQAEGRDRTKENSVTSSAPVVQNHPARNTQEIFAASQKTSQSKPSLENLMITDRASTGCDASEYKKIIFVLADIKTQKQKQALEQTLSKMYDINPWDSFLKRSRWVKYSAARLRWR